MDSIGLPRELAIKIVRGDGKRVIAIFADPNCHYCQQLEEGLRQVDNLTIYMFPYNILSVDSMYLSHAIWCCPDPAKAWDDWMVEKKRPLTANSGCEFPNDDILKLGEALQVRATPTIFFTDGTREEGAIPPDVLEDKLESIT